jgi:hypothetical protein
MTFPRTASAVIFIILFAATGSSQQKLDFSGRWMTVSPEMAKGNEQIVEQTASTLTVRHASGGGGHRSVYSLDGTESRNVIKSHGSEVVTVSKAEWQGEQLIITSKTTFADGREIDTRQTWSLNAEGRLVVDVTDMADGAVRTVKVVYEKKK